RGRFLLEEGHVDQARQALAEAAEIANDAGDRVRQFEALDGIARLAAIDRPAEAVRLASGVSARRAAGGAARLPSAPRAFEGWRGFEGWLGGGRAELGELSYLHEWDVGSYLVEADVIALGFYVAREVAAISPSPAVEPSPLTPREEEVLDMLARGLSTRQIAA